MALMVPKHKGTMSLSLPVATPLHIPVPPVGTAPVCTFGR